MKKLVMVIFLLFLPWTSHGDDMERAVEHFNRGKDYFESGRFEEAIQEFDRANMLQPSVLLYYNIAESYFSLGRLEQAVKYLRLYLRGKPDADDRQEVMARIRRLEEQIRRQEERARREREEAKAKEKAKALSKAQLQVDVDIPGAEILVDDKAVGRAPLAQALEVAPGPHRVRVEAEAYAPWEQQVDAAAGGEVNLLVRMQPLGGAEPSSGKQGMWIGGWVTAGVAVAALGTGLVLGGLASSAASEITEGSRSEPPEPWTDDLDGTYTRGETMEKASIGMYVVSGAAAVAAATLFVLVGMDTKQGEARVLPYGGATRAGVLVRF